MTGIGKAARRMDDQFVTIVADQDTYQDTVEWENPKIKTRGRETRKTPPLAASRNN